MISHRGYLIRHSAIYGTVWIEKDGINICHAKNVEDAKKIIDRDLTSHGKEKTQAEE